MVREVVAIWEQAVICPSKARRCFPRTALDACQREVAWHDAYRMGGVTEAGES